MLVALGIGLWGQNAESRQLGRIGDRSRTLAGASHELTTTSGRIASAAGDASGESERVATAAEEVSRSVQTVAAGTEQMNAAIQQDSDAAISAIDRITGIISQVNEHSTTIAAAVEQQTATIQRLRPCLRCVSVSITPAGTRRRAAKASGALLPTA